MVPADPEPPIGYQAELPRPDANPDALRDDIPAVDDLVYFNAGASGPSPRRVVEAAGSFLECREYDAPGGEGTYPVAFDSFDETRAAIADRIGGEAEEIALTQSTAAGIARVAGALDWEAGDAVVRTDAEHPRASSRGSACERIGRRGADGADRRRPDRPRRLPRGRPRRAASNGGRPRPRRTPDSGRRSTCDVIEGIGYDAIRSRIERLTDRPKEGLGDRVVGPRAFETGLVAFDSGDEAAERAVERLRGEGIVVRDLPTGTPGVGPRVQHRRRRGRAVSGARPSGLGERRSPASNHVIPRAGARRTPRGARRRSRRRWRTLSPRRRCRA